MIQVRLLSAAPILVPSKEDYLTKWSSGIRLTMSGSEPHTDMPQSLSEDYVCVVLRSPREIYTGIE